MRGNVPMSGPHTGPAARRARRPVRPLSPASIDARPAGLRVARGDLRLVFLIAEESAILWCRLHYTIASTDATTAGAGAGIPVLPLAPDTVGLLTRGLGAGLRLLQTGFAALAKISCRLLYVSAALGHARATFRGAVAPVSPLRELAVELRLARLLVAGSELVEIPTFALASIQRRHLQCPLSGGLATSARLVAFGPLLPVTQLAINGKILHGAALGFLQRVVAGSAAGS
mmetsp:Transcript_20775/g.45726  ORF Transcript_20775/g.45726 Transcript_20775/m.45726 type:complete len:230 (-) Transcript_20775:1491-2180(-)